MSSYFAIITMTSVVLYRRSGIHPFTLKYLKPVAGATFIGLIIYAFAKNVPLYPWMLPIYLIMFVGGYVFSQLITRSLDKEDILMFEAVSNRAGLSLNWLRRIIYKFAGN